MKTMFSLLTKPGGLPLRDVLAFKPFSTMERSKCIYLLGRTLEDFGLDHHRIAKLGILSAESLAQKIPRLVLYTLLRRVHQYKKGQPIAYILKRVSFLDFELCISPGIFIPRPETEEFTLLCREKITAEIKAEIKAEITAESRENTIEILEIGFGTGAISIALKLAFPNLKIQAVDSSKKAYICAKKNAASILGENHGIDFILADAFTSPKRKQQSKLNYTHIISNPPYIAENSPDLEASVQKYEPANALFSGKDGLDFYRNLALFLPKTPSRKIKVFLEIGFNQQLSVLEIFSHLKNKSVQKDFLGKPRFFSALYETA